MKAEISWVDALLSRWGRWSIRNGSGALGYAKMSIIAGAAEGDGIHEPSPPLDVTNEDFEAVSDAVMRLPIVIIACVVQVYIHGAGKPDSYNAKVLGISYRTMTQYIHQAQRKIALDISLQCTQNPHQSVNRGITPGRNQPVTAQA